jgi:hypothetical protein
MEAGVSFSDRNQRWRYEMPHGRSDFAAGLT